MIDVSYDREADAAYITLSPTPPTHQVPLDDSRILDYADDVLVGVELLSPSRGVDLAGVPRAGEIRSLMRDLGFEIITTRSDATGAR